MNTATVTDNAPVQVPAYLANSYRVMTADDLSRVVAGDRIVWLTAFDKGRYGRVLKCNGNSITFKTKSNCAVGGREWSKVVTMTAKVRRDGTVTLDHGQPLLVVV